MPSQVLTDVQRLTEDVVTAINTHADALDAAAKERLGAFLTRGTRWPDVSALLKAAAAVVSSTFAEYTKAERELEDERGDDAAPREERDQQALALLGELQTVKAVVEALYGPSKARELSIPSEIPRDPTKLLNTADSVLKKLKTAKLGAPQVSGVDKPDPGAWHASISTPTGKLRIARDKVNTEDKELSAAILKRDTAATAASEALVDALALARGIAKVARKESLFDGLRSNVAYGTSRTDPTPVDGAADPKSKPQ